MEASIEEAEKTDLDELKSTIEGEEGNAEDMKDTIHEEQVKEHDAEKAIKKTKKLREYEASVFAQESGKIRNHINTMKDAKFALGRGDELPKAAMASLTELSGN